jgi:adenylate cyclase
MSDGLPRDLADDRNEAERAAAKARHDLKTPINHIIGYSELLQEEAEEKGLDGFVDDLRKIQTAARRQLELIEEHFPKSGAWATGGGQAAAAPAPAEAVAARPLAPSPQPRATPGAEKGRLLVVDDNEMNRDMLARRLKSAGFSVSVAEDGRRALSMIEEQPVDLILLDIMMPDVSGLEVLQIVRRTRSVSDLPIIMATAMGASEDVVKALAQGANDYVTKPLDFPVVLARVRAQLTLKRQRDQIQELAEDLEVRNRFIQNTFGRYLSDEVVAGLLESPEGLRLGGESRRVTILMSDLRGFTAVSERLGPEQVVRMLNTYLGAMADVILRYNGTIDEFIGDAILALFGAPVAREDDAQRAVACALEMQQTMEEVNCINAAEGLPHLEMGVAVHTGEVVVGNIGSQKRTKYGIVGPPVNFAGRIESYTVGGQVLVSEATLREAGPIVSVGERILIKAKGSREPLAVYDTRGIGGEFSLFLEEKQDVPTPLSAPIPIKFSILEGKRVGDDVYPGEVVAAAVTGAHIQSGVPLRPLSNLQIRLLKPDGGEVEGDLYAKVMESHEHGRSHFVVRFTSVPPTIAEYLREALSDRAIGAGA